MDKGGYWALFGGFPNPAHNLVHYFSYSLCRIHLVQESRKIFYVDAQNDRFSSAKYGSFLVESPTAVYARYISSKRRGKYSMSTRKITDFPARNMVHF